MNERLDRRTVLMMGAAVGGMVGTGMAPALAETLDDVIVEHDVMVAMRDGIRLATDVYRPARNGAALPGRFPVVLLRTPYDKTRDPDARYFAARGYVVVYQDCRGTTKSEGKLVKYLDDGQDGYDTCAWIVRQPWCDGKIGTMGSSYCAHVQTAMASLGAPGLATMILDCGGFSNAYQGGIRQGGAYELKQVTWAISAMASDPEIAEDPAMLAAVKAIDVKKWFKQMPWTKGHTPLSVAPAYEDFVYAQWEHGAFDPFWQRVGIYGAGYYDAFPDVPTLHISSWYDPYPRTATENYMALKRRKKGPTRMILGPWTHVAKSVSHAGDVEFGPAATIDPNVTPSYLILRQRWFDHWLKGVPNSVASEPEVRLFVMGGGSGKRNGDGRIEHGGRWRDELRWPLPDAKQTPFYLQAARGLDPARPARSTQPASYLFDPARPVPTIGGTVTNGDILSGGAFHQAEDPRFFGSEAPYRPLADRPDVLVFQTPPLEQDVEVTGPIDAHLWISSDGPDTDFTIKLIDVYPPSADYPNGFAMNITDGIMRARYRDSWERPTMMKPGEVVKLTVSAFPTSNLFKAGHRIRLDISSSNFPHFDVNPNTGAPEGSGGAGRVARNTVFLDEARPSHVILPIIPPRA